MKIEYDYDTKIVDIIPENEEEYDLLYEWWINGVTIFGGGSYTSLTCTKYFAVGKT